jgi:hypothetical protein
MLLSANDGAIKFALVPIADPNLGGQLKEESSL